MREREIKLDKRRDKLDRETERERRRRKECISERRTEIKERERRTESVY